MKGKFKNTIGDDINNLIGTEGLRTDVTVGFDPLTIAILCLVIPVTVCGGILLADVIRRAIKK
jgi:hypothetical protein